MLKKDVELKGSAVAGQAGPLFLTADRIESTAPNVVEASGQVEARQAGGNFFADWLRYDTTLNLVEARGQVRLEQPALLVEGDSLKLNLDDYSGELTQPVYHLTAQQGRGDAERIDFIDENRFNLQNATYTTCPVDNDDWFLKVARSRYRQEPAMSAPRAMPPCSFWACRSCIRRGWIFRSTTNARPACWRRPSAPPSAAASTSGAVLPQSRPQLRRHAVSAPAVQAWRATGRRIPLSAGRGAW